MTSLENNLININAFLPNLEAGYKVLPRIKIKKNAIYISLKSVRIRQQEYSAFQDELYDKKDKEELKRLMRVLSKKARQCSMHLFLVTQTSGVDIIESSTRAQMNKVLLGNVMNNIKTSTFQVDKAEMPDVTFYNKGEGLIQQNKINIIRVPYVKDIENSAFLQKGAK